MFFFQLLRHFQFCCFSYPLAMALLGLCPSSVTLINSPCSSLSFSSSSSSSWSFSAVLRCQGTHAAPLKRKTIRIRRRGGNRMMMLAAAGPATEGGVAVNLDAPPSVLVDRLLSLVEGTDRGTQIGEQEKGAVNEIVAKLETLCIPEPLESPLLFGDWEVAYSSNPTAPGGYYRSMLGRAVLKTRDMVQSIDAPDAITNRVAFAALGLFDGQVTLQGKLTALDKKWVEVVFEAPEVALGSLKLQYGGNSTVKLAVIYLDDVVRIGRGSRGSLFIFKRRT